MKSKYKCNTFIKQLPARERKGEMHRNEKLLKGRRNKAENKRNKR